MLFTIEGRILKRYRKVSSVDNSTLATLPTVVDIGVSSTFSCQQGTSSKLPTGRCGPLSCNDSGLSNEVVGCFNAPCTLVDVTVGNFQDVPCWHETPADPVSLRPLSLHESSHFSGARRKYYCKFYLIATLFRDERPALLTKNFFARCEMFSNTRQYANT
ncbi:hypothetical protein EVAR_31312_1 [Eumeta japonica]|uniref:Uncharacterized protein n=1 Tax=Eumeta variegata TaxID=151549 RepID=A0A4C1VS69_EUMVA|nr:hypothetical protein EVAR_31312_1 [Eumeta japonica]